MNSALILRRASRIFKNQININKILKKELGGYYYKQQSTMD